MVLHGVLTNTQAEAVWLFRSCWESLVETLDGPCLARTGTEKRRGRAVDPENPADTARARRNYVTARAALERAGRRAVAAVTDIAERNRLPPAED